MQLNQPKAFFVTATDTNAGKTTATQYLIKQMQRRDLKVVGCKPIACGITMEGLNEDVHIYHKVNSITLSKTLINPFSFPLPASPNIAARQIGTNLQVIDVINALVPLQKLPVDYIFYEGAGGLKVPLNEKETVMDLIIQLGVPVILVVAIRVGCLNHTLLTMEALANDDVFFMGWLANVIDLETPAIAEHISTLQEWISAPYLGTLPFQPNIDAPTDYLNIDLLTNHVPKTRTHKTSR